jgi:hypothetical protein
MDNATATIPNDLSPADALRMPLHTRGISLNGWRRRDGLYDIEGELLDTKAYDHVTSLGQARGPGEPLHHMKIRLTVDEAMVVRAIAVAMPQAPFDTCQSGAPPLQKLVGATLGRGWRKAIDEAAGRAAGCTHPRELLPAMATAAFQAIPHYIGWQAKQRGEDLYAADTPPPAFGQCIGWDFDGPAVARVAPKFAGYRPPPR